jgi:hypothetical protein
MDGGVLIALGFAALVIAVAVVAARLIAKGRRRRAADDGDAIAMWEGVRQARDREE